MKPFLIVGAPRSPAPFITLLLPLAPRRLMLGSLVLGSRSGDVFAQRGAVPVAVGWDAGQLRHLLPTVSDSQILIKASFVRPLTAAPALRVGSTTVRGEMTDTAGECWQFRVRG